MLPVKLKTEVWTTYAHDFERVEQLKQLNATASSKKKKKKQKKIFEAADSLGTTGHAGNP